MAAKGGRRVDTAADRVWLRVRRRGKMFAACSMRAEASTLSLSRGGSILNTDTAYGADHAEHDAAIDLKELVVGLRWDPMENGRPAFDPPVDLDVSCVLFDESGKVVEIVHPGRPRNANNSVIHTGDSTTGAGKWDDESIFVFPEAVPAPVSSLTFVVATVNGGSFDSIPRASCHVSDRVTESERLRVELNDVAPGSVHCVATLYRCGSGWKIHSGARNPEAQTRIKAEILPLISGAKKQGR
ncbi:MAG: TerD family protein [Betaproteobacteria bacterium]|nr:TerD family protein [Betaproteobacteria bacterium]